MRSYDKAWKELLREFLNPMIESVLPSLYAELDLNEPPAFLDKEASDLTSHREVDLLVDLPLKNKLHDSVRILLHCEVQGRGGKEDLNFRMYRYKNLLELRYDKPIVALAIITEPLPKEQMSGEYRRENFETESIYRFKVLKVFETDESLAKSDNPFDMAQLAVARAWRASKDEVKRFEYLKEFVKILNEKGVDRAEKYNLLKFLETIFKIRKTELKQDYVVFLKEEKKEESAMLIIEEMAIKRGRAEGKAEGKAEGQAKGKAEGKLEVARKMLEAGLNFEIISKFTGLTESQLNAQHG